MSGNLYVVATPIGNLEDLTPRARQTLADVDLVAAEDTRHTGRLLSHLGLKKRLIALHDHNEEQVVTKVIAELEAGQSVALVSDAGTPLVSDPGYRLLRAAHLHGITVSPMPGASAVTAALSVAGLPTDRFCFEGFLPAKAVARRKRLQSLMSEPRTLVFFESVHRIAAALTDLGDVFGEERDAFIGRELSKLHEQCVQGSLGALRRKVDAGVIVNKGEFVIVVAGADIEIESTFDTDTLLIELAKHLPGKDAAKVTAKLTGEKKNALYQRLLEIRG
jgi:16S rRNA (cytidine1402-2'-O)-methyltransferase